MKNKILGLFLLVLLMATPAFAVMTATWNLPANGQVFNNLPSNIQNVDINFLITDNNADVIDHNITIILHGPLWTDTPVTLVDDMNVRDVPSNVSCNVSETTLLDSYNCNIQWTLPGQATLGDGTYTFDLNVESVGGVVTVFEANDDINALRSINIQTRLATGDTLRSLMAITGVILAAMVLIGGLVAALAFKTDPAKTAILTIVAAILVAIGAQIIGVVLAVV